MNSQKDDASNPTALHSRLNSQDEHSLRWGCLIPGAAIMFISAAIGISRNETEVWGDGLPWIIAFWLGFLLLFPGILVVWLLRPK